VSERRVDAAGGVVVRDGPRVAVVHRPKYDDWSLPKGKLDDGESFEDAALREVEEETGIRARLLSELDEVHYRDNKDRPKVVRYWVMEPLEGVDDFEPNDEVDVLEWLTPEQAAAKLSHERDRELVEQALGVGEPRSYEIERKWLVPDAPRKELDGAEKQRIEQGYLAVGGDEEPEVRLRRRKGKTLLTVKSGGDLVRVEEEIGIEKRAFQNLWPLTEGRRVEKTRHLVPFGPHTIEVDVFDGDLAGMVVAEVEFESPEASRAFEPPSWLGDEVTEDGRYKNKSLAVDGEPER
jgi:CYTH domain-containing protein/8-oxo-dGTP pyrophosphatase MutT (NUDIX family)